MIVFTALNSKTQQYYVGIATDSKENRWQKFVKASAQNIDAPIYQDIKEYGSESFLLSDYAETDDREELGDLVKEAIVEFNAISLQGVKTAAPVAATTPPAKKVTRKAPSRSSSSLFAEPEAATKIASGRTGSSKKEKNIREAIAKEKAAREQEKQAQIAAEADEMKAIMARLDSRSAASKRRR